MEKKKYHMFWGSFWVPFCEKYLRILVSILGYFLSYLRFLGSFWATFDGNLGA